MTNYQYKGIDINNIITGINSANKSTLLTTLPDLTSIPQEDSIFASTSLIAPVLFNSERPGFTGYSANKVDISTYSIAKYVEFKTSGSFTMSTMMGSTMATRMMAALIGGGGGGGAGTKNQYTAPVNVNQNINTDSYFRCYNNGYHSQFIKSGGATPANLGSNLDITVKLSTGAWIPIFQIRGLRGSGVNAVGRKTNLTQGDAEIFGTTKFAIQQLFNHIPVPDNTGFTALTIRQAQTNTTFTINTQREQEPQFAKVLCQYYVRPFTHNQFQNNNQNIQQNIAANNAGKAEGQAGTEGKFILLSSSVNQSNLNVNVGAAASGVAATTGQTTAVAGAVSSVTMGGVTYNSAQAASNIILVGATSTSQYSNSLNQYGVAGGGGASGAAGSNAVGQSGAGGSSGYVRVYLYYENSNAVYTGGDYTSLGTGNGTTTVFPPYVQSIWNTPNYKFFSHTSGPYILLNYTFYYSGQDNIGTYNFIIDDYAYLFFNGSAPIMGVWNQFYTGSIQLVNGTNYIQAIVYNTGGGVGFIASFFDSGSNLVAYTHNGWTSAILSPITPSATLVQRPVQGGLWTTLYNNNNQYYLKNGLNSISDINNPSYYYKNISNLSIISSSIVTNFSALTNINSTLTSNWGFKSTGFIVVPTSGRWTFSLVADDLAQLWIGTTSNTSGVPASICPSSTSNIFVAYNGGTVSYTVTLNTGTTTTGLGEVPIHYPILIYWGQTTGGQSFSLTVTNPSSQVVTHSSIFYYVNAAPSF
jgi:hypothetical protein